MNDLRMRTSLAALLTATALSACGVPGQQALPSGFAGASGETRPVETTVSTLPPVTTERLPAAETGLIPEQILQDETGTIYYSYYLPEGYDPNEQYPLMMVMPGYDMMWFGEDSSGANLDWQGFLCWTGLPEDMIVVSAQLTDWGGDLCPAGHCADGVFLGELFRGREPGLCSRLLCRWGDDVPGGFPAA